jgi:hypothetical protein
MERIIGGQEDEMMYIYTRCIQNQIENYNIHAQQHLRG